jgi:hypothetical protein
MMRRTRLGGLPLAVVLAASFCGVERVQSAGAAPRRALPEPVQYDPKPTALGDGSAEVLAVAYSPDRETLAPGGRQLASAAADSTVYLWDSLIPHLQARHTQRCARGRGRAPLSRPTAGPSPSVATTVRSCCTTPRVGW